MKVLSSVALAGLLLAASASQAQVPGGSYAQSCSGAQVAGNVLKAKCRTMSGSMVDTSLNLPCQGSIDNINGKLTCSGAPAANAPQGSYLQSCAEARVQDNTLHAKCRRANQTVADASLKLPCTGKIDNLNGVLTCVGGTAPPTGTVTASPPNRAAMTPAINCGTSCASNVAPGTGVTVQANPANGFVFDKWAGACAGKSNPCALTVSGDQNVSATFKSVGTTTVTATAPANGVIGGSGLNCGATCSAKVTSGSNFTVGGSPASNQKCYVFDKWTGDCAGQGASCNL